MTHVVTLPPRRVAYTASFGDPSKSDAFARLEQVVPLKGNRFYATFDPRTLEYRACVTLRDGEGGSTYGLPRRLRRAQSFGAGVRNTISNRRRFEQRGHSGSAGRLNADDETGSTTADARPGRLV